MTVTDLVVAVLIIALLGWAIYDQVFLDRRKGKTELTIPLLRRGRIDGTIFVGLIIILIYTNITAQGSLLTTWLLGSLALVTIYIFWLQVPTIRFKKQGFFLTGNWTEYNRIKTMNLSEDGVLVMELEKRRLLIRVKNIDDLERIYKFLIKSQ